LLWNPDIPTQFVVANDDDANPFFNIWDLRNPSYPVATFQDIHEAGIKSVAWCPNDSSLVVSSDKNNNTVVTNFKTGERCLKFNTDESYDKLCWSSQMPDKIAGYNFETEKTSILSFTPQQTQFDEEDETDGIAAIESGCEVANPEVSPTTGAPYAPKWLHPKSGVRFGFGGMMVSFHGKCLKVTKAVSHETESFIADQVTKFDRDLNQALQQQKLPALIDQKA